MTDGKYMFSRFLTLLVQFVFLVAGFASTILQLIKNIGDSLPTSGQNIVITIICFIVYVAIINYAIWGYKKKYIPYRIAITSYLLLLMTTFVRLMDIARAAKESVYISATCFLLIVIMCLVIGFDNTFKDHKSAAKVLGAIIVALELVMAIGAVIVLKNNGSTNLLDIMTYQPFARFFISSVLYASFISRTQWRNHDQKIKGE